LIRGLFILMPRSGVLRSPATSSCITLAYWTGVQTLPPARLFSSWVLQDHRYEMVDARVWKQVEDVGRQSPVTLLEYLPIRRGSRGPQKPFSSFSEGVGGVFTISTEPSEKTYVPAFTSSVTPHVLVVGGAGGYSLGTSPRNGCRNAWETDGV
jgi:hypothetical protein